jgi:cell division protein FtsZ
MYERELKRRERLRSHNLKLNNPNTIIELENEPAYMRRGVELDDVPDSSEEMISKYTISDDDEPEINPNNSFLHDNID